MRVRRHGEQQRVAVRRRAHDRFGGDIAAGARPVVDHDRLAQPLRQPLSDHAGNDVRRAARRRPGRPGGSASPDRLARAQRAATSAARAAPAMSRRHLPAKKGHPAALVDRDKLLTFARPAAGHDPEALRRDLAAARSNPRGACRAAPCRGRFSAGRRRSAPASASWPAAGTFRSAPAPRPRSAPCPSAPRSTPPLRRRSCPARRPRRPRRRRDA